MTAFYNALERSVRNSLLDRIRRLTDALQVVAPDHRLLCDGWATGEVGFVAEQPLRGVVYESTRSQIRRKEKRTAHEIKLRRIEETRFHQVIEVDSLIRHGLSKSAARKQVGMSRSAYDDWKPRLLQWLSSQLS